MIQFGVENFGNFVNSVFYGTIPGIQIVPGEHKKPFRAQNQSCFSFFICPLRIFYITEVIAKMVFSKIEKPSTPVQSKKTLKIFGN